MPAWHVRHLPYVTDALLLESPSMQNRPVYATFLHVLYWDNEYVLLTKAAS